MKTIYVYVIMLAMLFLHSTFANAVVYDLSGYISSAQNLSPTYSSLHVGDLFTGTFSYTPLLNSEMEPFPSSFPGWFNLQNFSAEVFITSGLVNIHEYLPILVVDINSNDNNGPDRVSFIEPFCQDHRFYIEDSTGRLISNNFDLTDYFADSGGNFIFCDTVSRIDFSSTYLSARPVPEPSTFLLLGAGLFGINCLRRRSANKNY